MIVNFHFAKAIQTLKDIDELMDELYDNTAIFGSWNFQNPPVYLRTTYYDLDRMMRSYIRQTEKAEIYRLRVTCLEAFVTAQFSLDEMMHLVRTINTFFKNFRVLYIIRREKRDLIMEFCIIPQELTTGNTYVFNDTCCDQIIELSDKIRENCNEELTAD